MELRLNGLPARYEDRGDRFVNWTWGRMMEKTRQELPKPKRPLCPECGREMVCIVLAFSHGRILTTWACDCESGNDWVQPDILRCREWEEQAIILDARVLLKNLKRGFWPYPAE